MMSHFRLPALRLNIENAFVVKWTEIFNKAKTNYWIWLKHPTIHNIHRYKQYRNSLTSLLKYGEKQSHIMNDSLLS